MKLSIIIPVYNVEAFVGKTLESVFETTASADDFEVIVVNDGTRDASMDEVRRFSNHSNITILEQENQGLSAARNRGLDQARGKYVWFVDSDDYLVEDGVGKVLRLLEERPGVEVLMSPLLKWDFRYSDQNRLEYRIASELTLSGKEAFTLAPIGDFGWIMRFVFLRSMLISNYWLRFPVGLLHEDFYFGAVVLYSAHRVSILPDPLYVYRVFRPGSITASSSVERVYSRLAIYRRLMAFMNKRVLPEDRGWFMAYCFKFLPNCYDTLLFGQQEFKTFVRDNGEYIYQQWRKIRPNASIITRIGRGLFYKKPELYHFIKKKKSVNF